MSFRAMTWVHDHSEATLGARLVLLVLAEYAHDDGTNAFPSVATISAKARMARSSVQAALRRLEVDEIECVGEHPSGAKIYEIVGMRGGQVTGQGGQVAGHELKPSNQDQLVVIPEEEKGIVTQPELPPDRPGEVNGKRVTDDEYELAHAILIEFDRVAGKNFHGPDWIRMIVMRIREDPSGTLDEHRAVIERAFADPWWTRPPNPRVIYGNLAVFQSAVAAVGTKPKERGMTPEEMEAEGLKREWTAEAQAAEFEQRHG